MTEKWTRDDLRSTLGEAFHTAFRKATDCPESAVIWKAIDKMPNEDWGQVLDFVMACLPESQFEVDAVDDDLESDS